MYNIAEIYILSAILLFLGSIFCLVAYLIEEYLDDDEPRLKRHPVNYDHRKMAEENETVDRR